MMKWIVRGVGVILVLTVLRGSVSTVLAHEEEFFVDTADVESVMLLDANTGTILFEKNIDTKLAPASTAKMMTAVLVMEHLSLDQLIEIPKEAKTNGSQMGVVSGDLVSVEALLYGMMLLSGNEAANALAIAMAGTKADFAVMMNQKAKEIGMENSFFVTASGLDAPDQLVTVRDMARLAQVYLADEFLCKVASSTHYTATTADESRQIEVVNVNRLLHLPVIEGYQSPVDMPDYTYPYANGLKTGSTGLAKGCLVASATKGGTTLLALLYTDRSRHYTARWEIATELFEYGFSSFQTIWLSDLCSQQKFYLDIDSGTKRKALPLLCEVAPVDDKSAFTLPAKASISEITYTTTAAEKIEAPVKQGQLVGTVQLQWDGYTVFHANLLSAETVPAEQETTEKNQGLQGMTLSFADVLLIGVMVWMPVSLWRLWRKWRAIKEQP